MASSERLAAEDPEQPLLLLEMGLEAADDPVEAAAERLGVRQARPRLADELADRAGEGLLLRVRPPPDDRREDPVLPRGVGADALVQQRADHLHALALPGRHLVAQDAGHDPGVLELLPDPAVLLSQRLGEG